MLPAVLVAAFFMSGVAQAHPGCHSRACLKRTCESRTCKDRVLIRRLGVKGIALRMLIARGDRAQFGCLVALWARESGWNATAHNARSGAHGIPQALPGSKMGPGWWANPRVQIRWGISYVYGRYGGPCAADAFQARNNWY